MRLHLDYGNIVYDKPNNETLIKLRKHNVMQHEQSLQSEGHLRKNSMLNSALNLSNVGDGLGNWLVFIKFSLHDYLSIYFN